MRTPGEFAAALFGHELPEGRLIATWELATKRSKWWRNPEGIDYLAGRENAYIGVALAAKEYGATRRVPAADAIGIGGLWLDLDVIGGPEDRDHGAPSKTEALRVGSRVLEPTLVVDSGWGIHTWHLLPEVWRFRSRLEQAEAAELAARWYALHARIAADAGWHLDQSTRDLARIMRLPGTVNVKGGQSAPVEALRDDGPRHETWELREAVAGVRLVQHDARACDGEIVGELRFKRDTVPPPDLLRALLVNSPEFANTWHRERPEFIGDQNRYDLALADIAVTAGWSDQDIATLIGAHRNWDLKAFRRDYILRTLHQARQHPVIFRICPLCHPELAQAA